MPVVNAHAPGAPCWYELHTSDPAAAKQFYCSLFGWTARDVSAGPPDSVYTMFQAEGRDVAAACASWLEGESRPRWLVYFHVPDVERAAAGAAELGGTVMAGPFDVAEHGRMAVLRDPEGAAFALWQPGQTIGAKVAGENNTVCWSELLSGDIASASRFYTGLLGLTSKPGADYIEFGVGDQQYGGFLRRYPEMAHIPPHWSFYVRVEDCDAVAERARELGATVLHGPFEAGDVGRAAILLDPQGAKVQVITLRAAAA